MIRRSVAIAVASLLPATGLLSSTHAAPVEVTVRIAKTNEEVRPFGTVEPARPRGDVSIRLFKMTVDGWNLIGKKTAELGRARDRDDDGVDESAYKTSFARPDEGNCKVIVRFDRDTSTSQEFPCFIPDFSTGTATLDERVDIDLLIADDNSERSYGLMYRPHMREELGMVFRWDADTSGGFWMKNTLIPLSIAFFDADGVILDILDMDPCTEDPCQIYDPDAQTYRGALEVNQGAFDRWDVSVGDRIEVSP